MTTESPAPIDPTRTALLVMDYQNGIVGMVENGDELVATAANLISSFREHGGTIGYVRVAFEDSDFEAIPATSSGSLVPREPTIRPEIGENTAVMSAIGRV